MVTIARDVRGVVRRGFGLVRKSPKFEKYIGFKLHFIHCTAHVTAKMRCGAVIVLPKLHGKVR